MLVATNVADAAMFRSTVHSVSFTLTFVQVVRKIFFYKEADTEREEREV